MSSISPPVWVRCSLITLALLFLSIFLFVPLVSVFAEAFKKGWDVYLAAITEADALSAVVLTLTAAVSVRVITMSLLLLVTTGCPDRCFLKIGRAHV